MRVLLIGFPLPNPAFDNHSFLQAPSFYDYDAVVIEPAQVSKVIEDVLTRAEDHQTYAGEPVLNEPSGPFVVGLADHLQRRRMETERLLAAGKLLVVFTRPNVPHSHVLGFAGYDRYSWLPAPPQMVYRPPHLMPADGRTITLEDRTHPFAALIDRYEDWFTYRAAFSERLPDFPSYGRVLMRSRGGMAIGVELRVGPGRILFLPALEDVPSGEPRFALAGALLEAIRQTLGGEGSGPAPGWAAAYTMPGLAEQEEELRRLSQSVREAEERVTEATARTANLAQYRTLLTAKTGVALERPVRAALRELGFRVEYDESRPLTLEADGQMAFAETEAADGEVNEAPYLRLQRRLEKAILEMRSVRKGVIVINGHGGQDPAKRAQEAAATLRIACENYRYALLTGAQLFEMVRSAREDPDTENLTALRRTIMEGEGLLTVSGASSAAAAGS